MDERDGRRGEILPGQGFDSGRGYGGAGNDNLYDEKSALPDARREDDDARDRGSAFDAQEGDFDGDSPLGGERREPGR